jgi:hypothetical protein
MAGRLRFRLAWLRRVKKDDLNVLVFDAGRCPPMTNTGDQGSI